MSNEVLLSKYQHSSRLFQLADKLTMSSPQRVNLKNLQGSSPAFVIAAIFNLPVTSQLNHLIVCGDSETAAYFHNTLENLSGALDIFYFPSSFKNNKNWQEFNNSHVMLRTEALTRWSGGGNKKIIVTCPEALFEKVVLPDTLADNMIRLKSGESIRLEDLMESLLGFGFERTDFVFEPGQFAIRGGILDIYSFGNEKPYRIELFGNEVDSIRIFNPESQLSERRLLQVNIIPNIETHFATENKISLFDFLPENTVIWMQDMAFIRERLSILEKELEQFLLSGTLKTIESGVSGGDKLLTPDDFTKLSGTENLIGNRHLVEFGSSRRNEAIDIEFHTQQQPSFNRRFERLIENLENWESKKFEIYLFAENPKQLERLHVIFEDLKSPIRFNPVTSPIHEGFIDEDLKIVCYTDHEIFQRYHKYKIKQAYNKSKAITLRTLRELQPGDYVTHIDHGVGVFSGLQKIDVNGHIQEAVRIFYKDSDILYVNINSLHKISKYTGKEGSIPKVSKLGSDAWQKLKEKTKTRVKEIAFDLIKLYAARKAQEGFAFSQDNYMQTELEASFIYEDTPDQSKATSDVKKDMESASPMDRLVCGDVGFGKTEVAIRAAFKACLDGKQAAVLVPTTILAFQHYKTFGERLKDFPVTVDYVNRFKSAREKKDTYKKLKEGKIDIIIGTHSILGKEVVFKDLGLLVIDEEQKFGVAHKEKIKTLRTNLDCLTLTATPIPRTLQFSLMGARDLSIMNTPPPNRQPIQTELQVFNEDFIRDAIYYEVERGGQVFYIYNRIQGLREMTVLLQELCPDVSIGYAHGQMEGHELEERILDFVDKKYDVLVCTNIVESGVDIPNVNTIIVQNAHQFGLSDLHQLRGRVGRSNKKAFCYLLAPSLATLPADARKRLQTLEQHSDLGSGFQIAMRDLDIRGAGNMLGGEQSGFMVEMGFEMYQKILDEAIRELKRTSFRDLFKEEIAKQEQEVVDCTIDTDLEILIPDEYVENITERLSLYTRLDNCETEIDLSDFYKEMEDRFGPVPDEVHDLFDTVRIRRIAVEMGFEKLIFKNGQVKFYFINRPDSKYFESAIFKNILEYIQKQTKQARLRQNGKLFMLVLTEMNSIKKLLEFMRRMHGAVTSKESVEVGVTNGASFP
jgi:transcription-repair coupling factor (superfamily II helicase)